VTEVKPRLTALRQIQSGEEVIQLAIRIGLLAFLVYWSFVLVRPFIPILVWSVVLAVALYPFFTWLSTHLGDRPRTAATLITFGSLAIVIGPAAWLGIDLIDGLRSISEQLGAGTLSVPSPPPGVRNWPLVGERLHEFWSEASTNLAAAFRELAPHLKPVAGMVLALAGSASIGTLKFVASVILAGFLFPSGPRLVAAGKDILARIVPQRSDEFVALAGATIRTISQGVIGIAIVQSLLIGIGLKLLGVPGAGVLAFVVLILGILQIGSAIVILPVIIWLWVVKDFSIALLATIYLAVAGLADNAVKPMLMGRGLSTPMPVIFIGLLGGTLAHGIVGLFVGPIILAVAWELMMAWIRDDRANPKLPDARPTAEN
jgi:predicted PurR-regulated permease PerM